jgi:hypothetical protein
MLPFYVVVEQRIKIMAFKIYIWREDLTIYESYVQNQYEDKIGLPINFIL